MKDVSRRARPRRPLKPRQFFRAAETRAIGIRKLLRALACKQASESSTSMDDAVALAQLVEQLAARGQRLPAADAVDLCQRVERVLGLLLAEVNAILASGNQCAVE